MFTKTCFFWLFLICRVEFGVLGSQGRPLIQSLGKSTPTPRISQRPHCHPRATSPYQCLEISPTPPHADLSRQHQSSEQQQEKDQPPRRQCHTQAPPSSAANLAESLSVATCAGDRLLCCHLRGGASCGQTAERRSGPAPRALPNSVRRARHREQP